MSNKIGFIGLGNMGLAMAKNIAKAGYKLTVFDLREEALQEMADFGAAVANSCRAVAECSDIIHCSVVNDAQVEAVMNGDEGILAGVQQGALVIIHSTINPDLTRRLANDMQQHGASVVDAAMSGAEAGAIAGTLTLMAGGSKDDLVRCQPLFEVIASQVFHMGETGMGNATKLVNNLVMLINMQGLSEGLQLAKKAGIDEQQMLAYMASGSSGSWASNNWLMMREIAQRASGGNQDLIALAEKDIQLAIAMAKDMDIPVPLAEVTAPLLAQLFKS
jgi:3-hydroxyisobutyrate dehydrogenase-like beta-hydroxyacid dehydrogenase